MTVTKSMIHRSSKKIVGYLSETNQGNTMQETILDAYNHGIMDAKEFVKDMAGSNPQHKIAFLALVEEMKVLPLELANEQTDA